MKILLFIRALDIGGSQSQITLLARGLAARDHDIAMIVLYPAPRAEALLTEAGVRVLSLEKTSRWNTIAPLRRLHNIIRNERAEVLYAFLPTQTVLAALFKRSPTKLVFGIRSAGMQLDQYDTLSYLVDRAEAKLSSRADLLIANAEAARASAVLRGMPESRTIVIPNGIDTRALQPAPEKGLRFRDSLGIDASRFVVGIVARLDPMKDHRTFLDAAAMFARKHPDAHFICVGDGPAPYRRQLQTYAKLAGLESRVTWAGEHTDVQGAYNSFNIASLSSAFGEAFPNVVGEAMACGIPVVATDTGDIKHLVSSLGEVIPTRRPDLLCAGWERMRQRLTAEPKLKSDVRQAIVTDYAVECMIDRTERSLHELVSGP